MSKKSEKLAKEQRLREAYEARVKAERNARVAQDVQRTNELAAQRKAKLDAWVDTRTPEQIKADRNRAIDYEKQSLDYVGLNIKGQSVEPEPEMKPLTDADKNMLDFVASQGASVQALAEIERDLRTAPAKVEETAGGTKMMYQPALLMPVMTNDATLNRNIVDQQAWLVGNRLAHAFTSDFVWHPVDKAWVYAPGWQKVADLSDAYTSYFARRS